LGGSFWALFTTQFLGAFNANLFKTTVTVSITFEAASFAGLQPTALVAWAGALLILPLALFLLGTQALILAAFDGIAEALRDGELVCTFPEGQLTRDDKLSPFRRGIERIIDATPVPVVPLALDGLWGSLFSRYGKGPLRRRFGHLCSQCRSAWELRSPQPRSRLTSSTSRSRRCWRPPSPSGCAAQLLGLASGDQFDSSAMMGPTAVSASASSNAPCESGGATSSEPTATTSSSTTLPSGSVLGTSNNSRPFRTRALRWAMRAE
jgi:acyltransferase-like protein